MHAEGYRCTGYLLPTGWAVDDSEDQRLGGRGVLDESPLGWPVYTSHVTADMRFKPSLSQDQRSQLECPANRGKFRYDTYVELLHPDDREGALATVAEAMASRTPYEVSHRVTWPDGSVQWLHAVAR